jgi:uncharacterized delta-60 repeat protein
MTRHRFSSPLCVEILEQRRLLSVGAPDLSFGTAGTLLFPQGTQVQAVAAQADGKLLIAGSVPGSGSDQFNPMLARLNSDGSLDTTFGTSGQLVFQLPGVLQSVQIEADGHIVAAGANGTNLIMVRCTAAGVPDPSLGGTGDVSINLGGAPTIAIQSSGLAIQPDGKVLVAGLTNPNNPFVHTPLLVRFNVDGTQDSSFHYSDVLSRTHQTFSAVQVQADGKILAGGDDLERLNPDGSADTSFGSRGQVLQVGRTFALQPDGRIVTGYVTYVTTGLQGQLSRLNPDGSTDPQFHNGVPVDLSFTPDDVIARPDGVIVVLGNSQAVGLGYTGTAGLAEFGDAGQPVPGFGSGGAETVTFTGAAGVPFASALALQADGRILVLGWNTTSTGAQFALDRFIDYRTPPAPSRAAVTLAFAQSREYYLDFVTNAYQQFLHRAPDAAGLNGWADQMQAGLRDEQLEADLTASPEYIANHGGLGDQWVRALYQDLLGRTASDAEVAAWLNYLNTGGSPLGLTYGLAASRERAAARVAQDYQTLLGRSASTDEVNAWTDLFVNQSVTNEQIVAGFTASPEYFNAAAKGAGDTPDWLSSLYTDILHRAGGMDEVAAWMAFLGV